MRIANKMLLTVLLLLFPAAMFGQNETFSDPNVDYTFLIPDPAWKMTGKPSSTSPNVEYVYNDRREAHLEVRKLTVSKDALMSDIMQIEEQKLQFLPGYVAGRQENFAGNLRGNIFNYEFIRAGRNAAGRFYFLKADDTTVYLLRFTGERDRLKSLRNQTDSIARTFKLR